MSRVAVASVAGGVIAAAGVALSGPGSARAAATVTVPGAAVPAGTVAGAAPAGQRLTVQVWLASSLTAAAAYATAVSTPGNAEFHHYLSPDAYTSRFGSPAASAAAVATWLTGAGLAQVHPDRGRDYVSATGTVARIQSALGVRIDRYLVAGAGGKTTVMQSSDRAVSVPSALAPDVLGVTGLNTAPPARPDTAAAAAKASTCSHYWAQYTKSMHLPAPKSAQVREQHITVSGGCGSSSNASASAAAMF